LKNFYHFWPIFVISVMLDLHFLACLIFSWIPARTSAFLANTSTTWLVFVWIPSRSMTLVAMRINYFMRLRLAHSSHTSLNMNLNDWLLLWHVSWRHIIAWLLLISTHRRCISLRLLLVTSWWVSHWLLEARLTKLSHRGLLISHWWLLISHRLAHRLPHRWLLETHRWLLESHWWLLESHWWLLESHWWLLEASCHWWLEVGDLSCSLSLRWVSCLDPRE